MRCSDCYIKKSRNIRIVYIYLKNLKNSNEDRTRERNSQLGVASKILFYLGKEVPDDIGLRRD